METTLAASKKYRSLTPRLAALLNLDPPFGSSPFKKTRVNLRDYMPSVPIQFIPDPNSMDMDALSGAEPEGLVRLEEDAVHFEFIKAKGFFRNKKEFQDVDIPLNGIESIAFQRPTWWRWQAKILVRFTSLETLNAFPWHQKGELHLKVRFSLRDEAHDLVNAIKMAVADRALGEAEKEAGRS